jgi:hypothetical protein
MSDTLRTEVEQLRRELTAWQRAVGQLDDQDAQHVYASVDAALAAAPQPRPPVAKLAAILESHAGWRSRVDFDRKLSALREFAESIYLSGYMQALIDHGLPTGDLAAQIEERNLKEGR